MKHLKQAISHGQQHKREMVVGAHQRETRDSFTKNLTRSKKGNIQCGVQESNSNTTEKKTGGIKMATVLQFGSLCCIGPSFSEDGCLF